MYQMTYEIQLDTPVCVTSLIQQAPNSLLEVKQEEYDTTRFCSTHADHFNSLFQNSLGFGM